MLSLVGRWKHLCWRSLPHFGPTGPISKDAQCLCASEELSGPEGRSFRPAKLLTPRRRASASPEAMRALSTSSSLRAISARSASMMPAAGLRLSLGSNVSMPCWLIGCSEPVRSRSCAPGARALSGRFLRVRAGRSPWPWSIVREKPNLEHVESRGAGPLPRTFVGSGAAALFSFSIFKFFLISADQFSFPPTVPAPTSNPRSRCAFTTPGGLFKTFDRLRGWSRKM